MTSEGSVETGLYSDDNNFKVSVTLESCCKPPNLGIGALGRRKNAREKRGALRSKKKTSSINCRIKKNCEQL